MIILMSDIQKFDASGLHIKITAFILYYKICTLSFCINYINRINIINKNVLNIKCNKKPNKVSWLDLNI